MSKFDMAGENPVGGGKVHEYRMGSEQNREFRVDTNFKIMDKDIEQLAEVEGIDRVTRDGKYCMQVVIGEMFEIAPAWERFRDAMDRLKESNKDKKGGSEEKEKKPRKKPRGNDVQPVDDVPGDVPGNQRGPLRPIIDDYMDTPIRPPTDVYPPNGPGDGWRRPVGPVNPYRPWNNDPGRIRWSDNIDPRANPNPDRFVPGTGAAQAREIREAEDRRVWDEIVGGIPNLAPLMDPASIRMREAEAAERLREYDEAVEDRLAGLRDEASEQLMDRYDEDADDRRLGLDR